MNRTNETSITLFTFITTLSRTDNIPQNISRYPHNRNECGTVLEIFCEVLSVPHNIVMDMKSVIFIIGMTKCLFTWMQAHHKAQLKIPKKKKSSQVQMWMESKHRLQSNIDNTKSSVPHSIVMDLKNVMFIIGVTNCLFSWMQAHHKAQLEISRRSQPKFKCEWKANIIYEANIDKTRFH